MHLVGCLYDYKINYLLEYLLCFSKFKCTCHHPISVDDFGWNENHVKCLKSSCPKNICYFKFCFRGGGNNPATPSHLTHSFAHQFWSSSLTINLYWSVALFYIPHYFYVYLIMCLTYNYQGKQRQESDPSEAILYTRRVRKYYNNSVSSTACFTLSTEMETNACDLDML